MTNININNMYWKSEEKVLGVLGVAPYATIDFLKKLADSTPAKKDWDHIRVLIDSNTKIPSRGRALELGEENPVPYMRKAIENLSKAGADFVIIACNTAHIFYDQIISNLEVEVLNMIKETIEFVLRKNKYIKSIGVLGSNNTVKFGLYKKYCPQQSNLKILYPEGDQKEVSEIIENVKQGIMNEKLKLRLVNIAEKLVSSYCIDAIIVGCTELSTLLRQNDISVPIYDSNEILAKIAIKKIKNSY